MLRSLLIGASFGLQFNPIAAVVSAAVAAAVVGYPDAPKSRWLWAALALAVGWAIGDGPSVAGAPGGLSVSVVSWVVTGLLVGYALPAATGAFVGRRVVHGTGWLAAGAVAIMLGSALAVVSGVVAGALWRVA